MDVDLVEMDDNARLRTWTYGLANGATPPVILVHGGPGIPDYLGPVAEMIADLGRVHRYDQRGVGGSTWVGQHTIARHVRDLELLIDAWGYDRVVLVGHSFGTDLATFFLLAHPERVGGIVYLSGPFVDLPGSTPWRTVARAVEHSRRSPQQEARLEQLEALPSRTEAEEIELLTLSWFTDHADPARAWGWAQDSAHQLRPINWLMNAQLNADKRVVSLESQIHHVRAELPSGSVIIGGEGDPRPEASLRALADRLGCVATIIPEAGHNPWLEAPGLFRSTLWEALERLGISRPQ